MSCSVCFLRIRNRGLFVSPRRTREAEKWGDVAMSSRMAIGDLVQDEAPQLVTEEGLREGDVVLVSGGETIEERDEVRDVAASGEIGQAMGWVRVAAQGEAEAAEGKIQGSDGGGREAPKAEETVHPPIVDGLSLREEEMRSLSSRYPSLLHGLERPGGAMGQPQRRQPKIFDWPDVEPSSPLIPDIDPSLPPSHSHGPSLLGGSLLGHYYTALPPRRPVAHRGTSSRRDMWSKPSFCCHICTRRAKSLRKAVCRNFTIQRCRKVICENCLTDCGESYEVVSAPGSTWICQHCRGLCPMTSNCSRYREYNDARARASEQSTSQLHLIPHLEIDDERPVFS